MIAVGVILEKLRAAGIAVDADALRLESRKGRTVALLDGDRIAWFPETEEGRASVAKERRILRLLERHCSFEAPRVIHEDVSGWDVRRRVRGEPGQSFQDLVRYQPEAARRLGGALGGILADQHTHLPPSELSGWLGRASPWPMPEALAGLPRVCSEPALLARINRALARRDAMARDLADPVLVHCDLGPWNLAVDPETGALNGVFDYGDAFLGDRHHDFKYMVFHHPDEQAMLEATIAAYEGATGLRLDRWRILFCNAIEAIGFLGLRHGHAPDEAPCGRTLAEDLDWTHKALSAVGF